jgi:hypothetical protein
MLHRNIWTSVATGSIKHSSTCSSWEGSENRTLLSPSRLTTRRIACEVVTGILAKRRRLVLCVLLVRASQFEPSLMVVSLFCVCARAPGDPHKRSVFACIPFYGSCDPQCHIAKLGGRESDDWSQDEPERVSEA